MTNSFRSKINIKSLIVGLSAFTIMACAESSGFQGGVPSKSSGTNPNGLGNNSIGDDAYINSDYFAQVGEIATQKFNLVSGVSKRVDIVWVIDNSASMSKEAAHVQRNFTSFINTLGDKTNLKVALISQSGGSTGVNLPKTGPNFFHVIDRVESTDALYFALYATCLKETNNFANHILCGQESAVFRKAFFSGHAIDPSVNGALAGFFRPDAHRVYIFVTDDDAEGVNSTNFLQLLKIANLKFTPTVFAFAALPTSIKCYDDIANEYISLAAQTGGKVFDMCANDWSQHFSELTSNVESIVNTEFLLRRRPAEILDVKIDNIPAAAGAYSLLGQKIKLNQGLISPASREFEVRYRVSK